MNRMFRGDGGSVARMLVENTAETSDSNRHAKTVVPSLGGQCEVWFCRGCMCVGDGLKPVGALRGFKSDADKTRGSCSVITLRGSSSADKARTLCPVILRFEGKPC